MSRLLVLALSFTAFACSSVGNKKIGLNEMIGEKLSASRYSNIYFSPQPSNEMYSLLKKEGFVSIVNLRSPSEYNEKEERLMAAKAGIRYSNIPFGAKAILNDEFINKVTQAVIKYRGEGKVLVHCSSGNRAGIWAGGHFFKDHGYSKKKSIKISKKLGITKEGPLSKLNDYLSKK